MRRGARRHALVAPRCSAHRPSCGSPRSQRRRTRKPSFAAASPPCTTSNTRTPTRLPADPAGDPGFAMAYWGEAMTYHQTLWRNENIGAARERVESSGVDAGGASGAAATPKDKAIHRSRRCAVWLKVTSRSPPQALCRRDGRALRGHAGRPGRGVVSRARAARHHVAQPHRLRGPHEGHSASLAGSETQPRVAAILGKVLQHASRTSRRLALSAAQLRRSRARAAGTASRAHLREGRAASSHAPAHAGSHLLAAGMWHEAAAVGPRRLRRVRRMGQGARVCRPALRSYHALSWLQYQLLQLGRYREAWATLGEIAPSVKASGDLAPAERALVDARALRGRDPPLGYAGAASATSATSTSCSPSE